VGEGAIFQPAHFTQKRRGAVVRSVVPLLALSCRCALCRAAALLDPASIFEPKAMKEAGAAMTERSQQRPGGGMFRKTGAWWFGAMLAITLMRGDYAHAVEQPRVLMLRGWFGVFSTGLDGLSDELKSKGINAVVAGHLYWTTALAEIEKERAAGKYRPIVLIGHSQGANNVIDISRELKQKNIPVDLVITLAPFLQYPMPNNVIRAVNFYQSPGWGAPITGEGNFHGKIVNINMKDDPTVLHINIDKSPKVHAEIVREILAVSAKQQEANIKPSDVKQ
jgi:hypothetical protein